MIYRVSSAHEEGGRERVYAVSTQEFAGDGAGRVAGLRLVEVELADGKFAPYRGPSGNCRVNWCCWPWASPGRTGRAC